MKRALVPLLAALVIFGLFLFWPTQTPASRTWLAELLPQASSGPLVAPDGLLGSFESTPFLPSGWSSLTGQDFRTTQKTGAVVRFYLTQKVPLEVDLEGRAEPAATVRLTLQEQTQSFKEFRLTENWIPCQFEIPASALREGMNQLVIRDGQATEWRQCHIKVVHSTAAQAGTAGKERTHLNFGRSLEMPALIQPHTSLIIDDLEPWIEPGAPSLDSPWNLTVRLQSPGLDLSWNMSRGGSHKILLPIEVPTQTTLSLMATTASAVVQGQPGLSLRNARLESPQPPPLSPTPASRPERTTKGKPNIVLYVVDTLRADHLHCYGYPSRTPHFDALSTDGVRFAQCMAQSSWTKASMASIMTSLLPHQHGAEDFPDALPPSLATLAQLLNKAGYENRGIVANACVPRGFGFAEGFAVYQEMLESDVHQLTTATLSWLEGRKPDKPFFLYFHALDPHLPYSPPPRFRPPNSPPGFGFQDMKKLREDWESGNRDGESQRRLVQSGALYDGEIASCDQAFGQFISALKARGLYDNTIIVLVSDHGEQFFEHNLCDHMNSLYQELLHVPLIIKFPHGQGAGTVIEPVWQHIDIAPTLLQQAGVAIPPAMVGVAYEPGGPVGQPDRPAYFPLKVGSNAARYGQGEGFARAEMEGIRVGPWVFNLTKSTIADLEPLQLFNLKTDGAEMKNLAFTRPEVRTWLACLLRIHSRPEARETRQVPDRLLQDSLRALQYLR